MDVLASRFDVPVTTIAAGPGFGKSTLLAQAIRRNQAAPRGVDAWVACQSGDENEEQFVRAILEAVGHVEPAAGGPPVYRVLEALRSVSPLNVCLVIDDLHELPDGCSALRVLGEVIRGLPAHAHLVLSGRRVPPLPLAKLRAAGVVIDIRESDLAFSPYEVSQLADLVGRSTETFAELAGWPSLVQLALHAPQKVLGQFLWEEVVSALPNDRREDLLALVNLGWGDEKALSAVCGRRVDLEALADTVPMISVSRGQARTHNLWIDAVERLYPADEIALSRSRVFDHLLDDGQILRAGSLAIAWHDFSGLRRAAGLLVPETLGVLPVDTSGSWLSAVPAASFSAPEFELLRVAHDQARDPSDPTLDSRLDAIVSAARTVEDRDTETAALALGAITAQYRGDVGRLFAISNLAEQRPGGVEEPLLQLLIQAVHAAVAELSGDVEGALALIGSIPDTERTRRFGELIFRMQTQLLFLTGRGSEAVEVAEMHLRSSKSNHVTSTIDYVRWMNGDPSGFRLRGPVEPNPSATARDQFHFGMYYSAIFASVGDIAAIDRCWSVASPLTNAPSDPRDNAIVSSFLALKHVVNHDETAAREVLTAHVARHPMSVKLSEVHLRRAFAVSYVLVPEVKEHWDTLAFGPSLQRTRHVAATLVHARAGRLGRHQSLPSHEYILTALPLPWSVELATRAEAVGHDGARALVEYLGEWAPAKVHEELHRLGRSDDDVLRRGARALLGAVAQPANETLRIEVLGPMRLLVDNEVVQRPEMRRIRVRELLTMLVVRDFVTKEQAMDALWPDADPETASRNLRITLSRLRLLLEPDRPPGEATYFLRVDRSTIRLARVPALQVDLWEFDGDEVFGSSHNASAAHEGVRNGLSIGALALGGKVTAGGAPSGSPASILDRILRMWRGDPLPDLERLVGFASHASAVRERLHDAVLRLGEIHITEGRGMEATRCAERVLLADPLHERAHRLAIAARLIEGDAAGTASGVNRLKSVLLDLGVEPEPVTRILLRQAEARALRAPDVRASLSTSVDLRSG